MRNKVNKKLLTTPQFGIVTYAVYLLDGHRRAVDTEDIAVKVHQLAPGRFSWRKYPEQINLELVRASLSDAKKAKNGGWVTGVGRTGWTLTPVGLQWVQTNMETISRENFTRPREESRAGSIDENRWRRERVRILGTNAWRKWLEEKKSIAPRDAAEVFRLDNYSIGSLKTLKINRLMSQFVNDSDIEPFIRQLAKILEENSEEVSR